MTTFHEQPILQPVLPLSTEHSAAGPRLALTAFLCSKVRRLRPLVLLVTVQDEYKYAQMLSLY